MTSLSGRVAVVSGGGRGARPGVLPGAGAAGRFGGVVNNRNRVVDGDGLGPADRVVAEILAFGGSARADC